MVATLCQHHSEENPGTLFDALNVLTSRGLTVETLRIYRDAILERGRQAQYHVGLNIIRGIVQQGAKA